MFWCFLVYRYFALQRLAPLGARFNSGKVSGPVIGIDLGSEYFLLRLTLLSAKSTQLMAEEQWA